MLPALFAIAIVMAFPLVYLVFMSFHKWSMVGYAPPSFVGFSNFTALLDDERFVNSLGRTFLFTALGLASNIPVGFAIALLLVEDFPTRSVLRALLILPMVATPVAMGLVWVVMLDPSLGVVRYLFTLIGVENPPLWLSDAAWVVPTLVAVDAWMWTPMVALICIAGLTALPGEPFEAAMVDGAIGLATVPLHHLAANGPDARRRGDAAGDGSPEGDRHRLRHDRRRTRPRLRDDQSLQLSGRALLRQDRLRRSGGTGSLRGGAAVHCRARTAAAGAS